MAKITNTDIHSLAESIYRSGYPMMDTAPTENEFRRAVDEINMAIYEDDYSNTHIKRAINLANAKGGGHDQFLTGITVDFDLTFSNKAWVEAERYTFMNFVSSMSTMHRISKMPISECCNDYVSYSQIENAERYQKYYNSLTHENADEKKEVYLQILYNLPAGFEITAAMTTNYRCLKNIYQQRRTHRLPDWQIFCDWVETLPMAKELICGGSV